MKYAIVLLFLAIFSFCSYGQKNIDYINLQTQDLQNNLQKSGAHLKLNNSQIADLHQIFEDKFQRVEMVLARYTEKSEVSREMTRVENEFDARVANVLSVDQRLALQPKQKKRREQSAIK